MRWLLLLVAGCGRYGFDATATVDAETADLVAVYAMDDDPGAGTLRASSVAFDGRCSLGACPTPIAGQFGGGLAFDGNDAVVLPPELVGLTPYSVAVWIRPQTGAIFAKPHSVTNGNDVIGLFIDGRDGAPYFETCSVPGAVGDNIGTTAVDLRQLGWRHLAATWDGTTKRMYVDGVIAVSGAAVLLDSAEPVRIGVDFDLGAPVEQYTGDMDELRVYRVALAAAEIAVLATP